MFGKIKRFIELIASFVFQKTLLPIFLTLIYFTLVGFFKLFLIFSKEEKCKESGFFIPEESNLNTIEEMESQS